MVYYQNVRGLRTKIDNFLLDATESSYDIVVLTETWLDDKIYSAQLFGDKYTVFRNDRNQINSAKSRGGGVLIAVSTRLSCSIDPSPICETLEQLWIRIKTPERNIIVGVLYLPPNRKSNCMDIEAHVRSIGLVASTLKSADIFLQFDDYNQSGIVWSTHLCNYPLIDAQKSNVNEPCSILLDGFSLHGLTQINTVIYRNGKLLDLVLTNEPGLEICF